MNIKNNSSLLALALTSASLATAMAKTPVIEKAFPSLELKSPKNKPWYNKFNKKGKK